MLEDAGVEQDGSSEDKGEGARDAVGGNQERYLLAERFTDASYPLPFSFRTKGLDPSRLAKAFDETVAAHAILRTDFFVSGTGFARRPAAKAPVLAQVDWSDLDDEQVRERVVDTIFAKSPELTAERLVRSLLVRRGPDEHLLVISLHHSISDGTSTWLFMRDLADAYNGRPLPAEERTYWDVFNGAFEGASPQEASEYWRAAVGKIDTIRDLPDDLAVRIPVARQRAVVMPLELGTFEKLAACYGATLFTVAAALSHVIFARFTASQQSVVTFQSSGRKPFPASKGIIGPFSNSVVLVGDVRPDKAFATLVAEQKQAIAAAIAHEILPYHIVVRETGVQPRFGINWYPSMGGLELDGVEASAPDEVHRQTNYDLDFRFVRKPGGLELIAWHDNGRYSRGRIEAICAEFKSALERLSAEPDLTIKRLFPAPSPLIVPKGTRIPAGRLFDRFLECAATSPERVALLSEDWQMTYGEVEAASARLARRLVAAGLGPGMRVGIIAERGPQLVWTLIAVLRIGATMVPLDSSYPDERLAILAGVAQLDALLLTRPGAAPAWAKGIPLVLAAKDPKAPQVAPGTIPDDALAAGDPDGPAYILFTSGSTGVPKGIATSHRPPLNFLRWQRATFGITADDRFTNLNGVAHDMMIRDIFQPLSIGAQLAIPHQADIYRPGRLLEWLDRVRPTVAHMTPAMGQLLCLAAEDGQSLPMRAIFFGGDRLLPDLTAKLHRLAPGAMLVNFYGATETPQAASFHVVDPDAGWSTHPVGHGIENFDLRIVDADRQPAAPGVPGEIAVLTPFLSLGYVREHGIEPHGCPGTYFTGDNGFTLESGEVMFTGRRDDQVSIRGYRIELEEINRALKALPGVCDAQVLVEGSGVTAKLVGFVAGDSLDSDVLYAELARGLPGYMLPGDLIVMDRLLLLPNGKVDRSGLLALPRPERKLKRGRPPETATERRLIESWGKLLGISNISPDHSFAELHADSLNYVQVMLATESVVGTLPDDWDTMPLAEIAKQIPEAITWWKWVDSVLLARALAIVLVAALHLHYYSIGGGSTSGLLLVSGFFIGRLQMKEAFEYKTAAPMWHTFGRIALPAVLYSVLFYSTRRLLHLPSNWAIPFLYSDMVDLHDPAVVAREGYAVFLWYLSALLHIILFVAISLEVCLRLFPERITARSYLIGLFVLGCIGRFIVPPLVDPNFLKSGIEGLTALAHLPSTHLATYALGALVATAKTKRERIVFLVLVLAYAGLTAAMLRTHSWMLIIGFAVLILFIRRLPAPRGIHWIVLVLSGSSLFIYLTHQQFATVLTWIGVPRGGIIQLVGALGLGCALWLIWQRFVTSKLFRRSIAQVAAREEA